jgi:hypothetical protein
VNAERFGVPIAADEAMDWARGSLAQGSTLAMSMTQRLESFRWAWLVAPPDAEHQAPPRLDELGHGIKTSAADLLGARLLPYLTRAGLRVLLVEDDLARRGDPNLGCDVAFVGERVVRWSEAAGGPARAVALLRSGSSGYPLNAFLCRASAKQLGLEPGIQIDAEVQELIVESAEAVIVSVYDAEAFVALVSSDVLDPRV